LSKSDGAAILAVYPSCFYFPVDMERVEIKTSLLWLASYLHQFHNVTYADFEVEIGRPNTTVQINRFQRLVRQFLEQQDFDILAISCWTSLSYQASMAVARICRELYPRKIIVVGGYHPSARPHEFITEEKLFDYVITREGELALKEIADHVRRAGRPAETQIVVGPTVSLDQFIGYDWGMIDDFFHRNFPGGINNFYMYLSRGCPFGCSFCMEPAKARSWRAFTPEDALRHVTETAERFNLYCVAVSDACFGMRPGWRKEFIRRLVDCKPNFWVVFETRPEYLDPDDIKLLAGLKVEIQFGLESGSPEMLRIMKKTRQPEKFLRQFSETSHLLSEHKILHRANLIFNHPGETRKTLDETFAYIDRELELTDSYLMWAVHGFMHFPGCDIDLNRPYYEETFGSRFICGDWWKENQDQYENCMRFVPSRDLENDVDRWRRMMKERDARMRNTLAPTAFNFAALKYFLEWRDDYRYKNR